MLSIKFTIVFLLLIHYLKLELTSLNNSCDGGGSCFRREMALD